MLCEGLTIEPTIRIQGPISNSEEQTGHWMDPIGNMQVPEKIIDIVNVIALN